MDSLKTILLEYKRFAYLIPAVRFINLVRPKEVIMQKGEIGVTYQGQPINLIHGYEEVIDSIYCAILHPADASINALKTIIPLTNSPKPLNLSSQQIAWHHPEKKLALLQHPDYQGMIVQLV